MHFQFYSLQCVIPGFGFLLCIPTHQAIETEFPCCHQSVTAFSASSVGI